MIDNLTGRRLAQDGKVAIRDTEHLQNGFDFECRPTVEKILQFRSKQNICWKIGNVPTILTYNSFVTFCTKTRNPRSKKWGVAGKVDDLQDCNRCPIGQKIDQGKKVRPKNIKFITQEYWQIAV